MVEESSSLSQIRKIRENLKIFPYLRDIVKEGFDYNGFCKDIEKSSDLTPAGKELVKDLFNPNKRIASAIIRGAKHMEKQYIDVETKDVDSFKEHPIQKKWEEVWNDTKGRFAKEVGEYDRMMAKLNEKRGRTPDSAQYPHIVPVIDVNKSKIANAMITFGDNPELQLSEGFMQLPEDQQKAILYHEARHAFEPVTAKVECGKYLARRLITNGITLNATSRHHEYAADENAAAFGHSESLAKALENVIESQKPELKEAIGGISTAAKTATNHGFAIDRKKAAGLIGEIYKPKNIKQQMLRPIVQLGSVVTVSAFDKAFRKMATKSPEQIIEESSTPTMWGIKVGTHPPISERIERLNKNVEVKR